MNKTIKNYATKAEGILEAATVEIQKASAELEEERKTVDELKKAVDAARAAADKAAYRKARHEYEATSEIIDMYSEQLDALEKKSLVSEDEYNKAVSDIMNTFTDEDRQAREKIIALADEIKQIIDALCAMVDEGNAILHKWQYDIYKDERVLNLFTNPNVAQLYGVWDKKWKDTGTIALSLQALERLDLLRR